MKTFKFLKAARAVVALLLFCLISAQFLDVYHSLGKTYWATNPTSLMYAPSLLKALSGAGLAAGWAFIAFSLAAFAFGRAYCSFACPFGILMDILRRISVYPAKSRLLKNTAIGKFCKKTFAALKYSPAVPFARWIFLALSVAAVAFGYGALFGFVEPYSLYGKIMGGIVHPAASVAVDESGRLLANFGVYSIPPVGGDPTVALASFAVAIIILVAIWAASALSGRIYCNTICPVGALLGLFSKAAVFKLSIDKSSCVSCGLCERNCKSKCIDSKGKTLDFSRCVLCFNCAANCPKKSISFEFIASHKEKPSAENCVARAEGIPHEKRLSLQEGKAKENRLNRQESKTAENSVANYAPTEGNPGKSSFSPTENESAKKDFKMPRRSFAAGLLPLGAILCSAAKNDSAAGKNSAASKDNISPYSLDPSDPRSRMPSPPGSVSVENFLENCTGCQICTAACKAHILKPSTGQWGLSGFMRPYMDYLEGFCLHACRSCSDACPTGAIKFITEEQKRFEKIGTAIFKEDLCVVKTDGTDCAACAEHCPVQAIEMIPFGDPKNSLYIPHVHEDVCIGCGACEYICPVLPKKAIVVRGLAVHTRATPFDESMRIYKPEQEEKKPAQNAAPVDTQNPFPF